jgi:hypothetical protein
VDFSQALDELKQGRKVTRQRWTDAEKRDQWIVRQDGHPQGVPLNRNTAQATGLPEGSEQKFAPYYMLYTIYSTFVPWTPGHGDLNAEDWEVYYLPGEKERLEQEETAEILADEKLTAELVAAGKDPQTFSLDELRMALALRKLESEDLPDREDIRFRLVRQLLRPVIDQQRQIDGEIIDIGGMPPGVAETIHAFVTIITKINEDLTQTKLVLDSTREKLDTLDEFNQSWLRKYPVPDGLNSNDAILAHHRIRYYQEGWANSPRFTQTTWRLISALLAPMLEEWRQSHADTTGDFDPDRFKVTFHGARNDGIDTIGHMGLERVPRVTDEQVKTLEAALERLGDPEATQQLIRPGDPGYPERPQRLTDLFPLRQTFGVDTPAEVPRQIRRAAPDAEPTQVVKYFVYSGTGDNGVEEEVTEGEYLRAADITDPSAAVPDTFTNGLTRGRMVRHPQ